MQGVFEDLALASDGTGLVWEAESQPSKGCGATARAALGDSHKPHELQKEAAPLPWLRKARRPREAGAVFMHICAQRLRRCMLGPWNGVEHGREALARQVEGGTG